MEGDIPVLSIALECSEARCGDREGARCLRPMSRRYEKLGSHSGASSYLYKENFSDSSFPQGFLWGASTAAHQIEGNNINNDWWQLEQIAADYGVQFSGDALDSYHRYEEDMSLLARAGFNAYRFSIEWSRIEPRPGKFSRAETRTLPPHDRHREASRPHPCGHAPPLHTPAMVR